LLAGQGGATAQFISAAQAWAAVRLASRGGKAERKRGLIEKKPASYRGERRRAFLIPEAGVKSWGENIMQWVQAEEN